MPEQTCPPRSRVGAIDPFVKAFEAAWDAAADGPPSVGSFLPRADDPLYARAVLELVRVDLELGWEHGRPRTVDDYRAAYPAVFGDPAAVRAVAFEEYRQRREHGEDPDPADYARQYGIDTADWPPRREGGSDGGTMVVDTADGLAAASMVYRKCREEGTDLDAAAAPAGAAEGLDLLRAVHKSDPARAHRLAVAALSMPDVGQEFLGFYLEAELGRGAFGRVFLARDLDLANRQVALKVTADISGEEQTLAQLQHTNIVPLYDRKRVGSLQAVIMPYAGGTTLADVIRGLRDVKALPGSGKHLLSTINDRKLSTVRSVGSSQFAVRSSRLTAGSQQRADAVSVNSEPPTANFPPAAIPHSLAAQFEGQSYVEAVLWIGSRLAGGLAYAHDRGVIHRDLKPANVLLRDDGEPMLLDFNLADDARLRDRPAAARMGGTLPYMSPEQLAVFGGGLASAVDGRTDVYSLGLILFELLTGRPAFPNRTGPFKDAIPAMLADRRQPPPRLTPLNPEVTPAVEAIVRKCLEADAGRRYPSARALQEDVDRHLANKPLRHVAEPSPWERTKKWARRHPRLTSSTTVGVAAAVVFVVSAGAGLAAWKKAERDHARLVAEDSFRGFESARHTQQALLNRLLNAADPDAVRKAGEVARAALATYGVPDNPAWQDGPLVAPLPESVRERLRNGAGELLATWADAEHRRANQETGEKRHDALNRAWQLTEDARACLGGGDLTLAKLRAAVANDLGRDDRTSLAEKAARLTPRSAADHYRAARDLIAKREYRKAVPLLVEVTRLDPGHFWAWNNLAACHYDLGQWNEAATCYGRCIGLTPDPAVAYFPYFYRARAYAALGRLDAAEADVDRAVELLAALPDELLKEERAKPYVLRAQLRKKEKDYAGAEEVLTKAIALVDHDPTLHLERAAVRELRKDKAGAKQDREAAVTFRPVNAREFNERGLAYVEAGDFAAALADFDRAVALDPTFRQALQNKANLLAERLHRPDESLAVLNRLIELYPNYVLARLGRGVLLARQGKRAEAHADAAVALANDQKPMTLYQAANVYALTSKQVPADAERVLPLLAAAVWSDDALAEVDADDDMKPVREREWFKQVVRVVRAIKAEAAKQAAIKSAG